MASVQKVDQTSNTSAHDRLAADAGAPLVPAGASPTTDHAHDDGPEKVAARRDKTVTAEQKAEQAESETKAARDAGERIPQPTNTEVAEGNTTISDAYRTEEKSPEDAAAEAMRARQMAPVSEVQDPAMTPNPAPLADAGTPEERALREELRIVSAGFAALLDQHPTSVVPVNERDMIKFSGAQIRFRDDPDRGGYQFFSEQGPAPAAEDVPFRVPSRTSRPL